MTEEYIRALDEYFCARYSDYVRLSALDGYKPPVMVSVGADGNIVRRESSAMRLCYQSDPAALLARLKGELADTTFTFSYSYPGFRERMHDLFNKETFAKLLPAALARCGETAESAGEKLTVLPEAWKGIVKGKLYPEKNTVLALALVCRMTVADANNLLSVCGFTLVEDNVRDVVVGYLLERQIFNPVMRDKCLAEYSVTNLPIAREKIA